MKNKLAIQHINGIRLDYKDIDKAEEWEDLIGLWHIASEVDKYSQWYKGDIAARIGVKFGEDSLGQFAQEVGENRSTLDNYRRVARAFPPTKRNYNVPFSIFLASSFADSFNKKDQKFESNKRFDWIEKAEERKWSFQRLRYELGATQQLEAGSTHFDLCVDYVKKFENILLQTKLKKKEWKQIIKKIDLLLTQIRSKVGH